MKRCWFWLLAACIWTGIGSAQSIDNALEPELLPPDEAFAFHAELTAPDNLRASWRVADGYYLYRERIRFTTPDNTVTLGDPKYPQGKAKDDEFFGRVEIYRGDVVIDIPVERHSAAADSLELSALSQGCADIGVCYPPHMQVVKLALAESTDATPTPAKPDALGAIKALGNSLGLGDSEQTFLPVEQAFQFDAEVRDANTLVARWVIAENYYLYRDKLEFRLEDAHGVSLLPAVLPAGKIKEDEFFGRMEVYHMEVVALLPLQRDDPTVRDIRLTVGFQGCAEAGICYPPHQQTVALTLPPANSVAQGAAPAATASAPGDTEPVVSEQDRLARVLVESPLWASMLVFFGLGIGLAFTPCVFPMVPILSSIIAGQGEHLTTRRAFLLSSVYVLAMALTYTVAGVFAAKAGQNLQAAFQNPWILGTFALIFVALSLSMFGLYEMQVPAALQTRLSEISQRQRGGSWAGVATMGFLSALIVGPCVAAPLVAALLVISKSGDTLLGGGALFALSIGMGLPLIAFGTGTGTLLPKAGPWMDAIKAVFGVLLLAVAIWMLERVLPGAVTLALWAVLMLVSAIYLGVLEPLPAGAGGWRRLWKGLGLVLMIYGVLLMIGATGGSSDILQPLRGMGLLTGKESTETQHLQFARIKTVADLEREVQAAAARGQYVMVDFYADWCVTCKEMEKYTFARADVQQAVDGMRLLQADVTANDADDTQLLNHFGLIGPPTILFFGPDGREHTAYRLVGFLNADRFRQHVERLRADTAAMPAAT